MILIKVLAGLAAAFGLYLFVGLAWVWVWNKLHPPCPLLAMPLMTFRYGPYKFQLSLWDRTFWGWGRYDLEWAVGECISYAAGPFSVAIEKNR